MSGEMDHIKLTVFDYNYIVWVVDTYCNCSQTVAFAELGNVHLSRFSLDPESIFHKIGEIVGFKDIDFPENKRFSDRYLLKGADEAAVRAVFKPERSAFLSL